MGCLVVGSVACGGGDSTDEPNVIISQIIETPVPTAAPPLPSPQTNPTSVSTPGSIAATPTRPPTNGNGSPTGVSGFSFPLAGGCLPKGDQLMPNAPRPYRNGVHEGVDFYDSDSCTGITRGTQVLAAKPGTIVRADLDYRDITAADVAKYEANPNTEEALNVFRGRQVWVDHGIDASGVRIITRYCHLSAVASGITVGTQVTRGQIIAAVGESGTPESVSRPGSEYHLHFEIRTGDSFLGKSLPPAQVRALYVAAFAQ